MNSFQSIACEWLHAGLTNTFKDLNPGLDSLQSVVVTFTKDPVNGYIKPVSSALYVLSSVTLIGIDKAHFSENEKVPFSMNSLLFHNEIRLRFTCSQIQDF